MTHRDRLELEQVARKLAVLKREGYGKLEVMVQGGRVVYTNLTIGEQMSFEEEKDGGAGEKRQGAAGSHHAAGSGRPGLPGM